MEVRKYYNLPVDGQVFEEMEQQENDENEILTEEFELAQQTDGTEENE